MSTPVVTTADYAYFRLRDEGYQPADIERWAGDDRGPVTACATPSSTSSTRRKGKGPEFATALGAQVPGELRTERASGARLAGREVRRPAATREVHHQPFRPIAVVVRPCAGSREAAVAAVLA